MENLVLTEKGDLDEDKYSLQVKTSDLLDKAVSYGEGHRGSAFREKRKKHAHKDVNKISA